MYPYAHPSAGLQYVSIVRPAAWCSYLCGIDNDSKMQVSQYEYEFVQGRAAQSHGADTHLPDRPRVYSCDDLTGPRLPVLRTLYSVQQVGYRKARIDMYVHPYQYGVGSDGALHTRRLAALSGGLRTEPEDRSTRVPERSTPYEYSVG